MSGDVQPRKRKDKRRKRADEGYHVQRISSHELEDDDAGTPPPTLINPSADHSTDNVTIHVHKDGGTGGHWCARIIFFALFTALIGLVGVIILETRGTTDVDTPVASSRWAAIFEGWVDDVLPSDHEPESEETDDKSEEDEHADEEEGAESEELAEESEEVASEEHDATEEESAEVDEATEEQVDSEEDVDEGYSEADEESADLEEEEESEDDEEDEDDIINVSAPDLDVSIEGITRSSKEEEDEGLGDDSEEAEDNSEELEEDEEDEEDDADDEEASEKILDLEEESTSVAVKFGVGVALIVTAHFVLVRRWNNVDISKYPEEVQDLTRRNTIIPPGSPKQQELKDKYRDLPIETITSRNTSLAAAKKDAFLKSKEQDLLTSESERCSGTEQESDFDEGDPEDEEEVEEEEDEEAEEEVDDTDLVAKLEAKYGKLPTPSQSEESEEVEESEEYSEEEVGDWKRVNVPKAPVDEKKDEKPREVPRSRQGSGRGGYQEAADVIHATDIDELIIQEDVENNSVAEDLAN